MIDIEKLDSKLYNARYVSHKIDDVDTIWAQIKNNPDILREAVKIRRDKWNTGDIVNGLTIADSMLIDYTDLDQVAYDELIKSIYSNTDIARIVVGGASNGGCSFLLMSLWDHNLKLTEEQKQFAVNEAMNKVGTTRNNGNLEYTFAMLHNTQAHGKGAFDIRYHILRNPNWTLDEKQKLIMDFYDDDEYYDDCLDQWELGIVNDFSSYKGLELPTFDQYELLNEYSYEMLLKYYGNEEIVDRIWAEIQFCNQMHQLRPQQWELDCASQKVLAQPNN